MAATCPWRRTRDPYRVLVSEVMLQQTQVDRVLPKYEEWLDRYPELRRAGGGRGTRRHRHVVPARLQHPAEAPAGHRARVDRTVRRHAAGRRGDAPIVQGHRRLHGRRGDELRVRQARGNSGHQRRPRAVPRVRRTRRAPQPSHGEAPLGRFARGAPPSPRVRLQSGADGFRRDGLLGAKAAVLALSAHGELRVVSAAGVRMPAERNRAPSSSSPP